MSLTDPEGRTGRRKQTASGCQNWSLCAHKGALCLPLGSPEMEDEAWGPEGGWPEASEGERASGWGCPEDEAQANGLLSQKNGLFDENLGFF